MRASAESRWTALQTRYTASPAWGATAIVAVGLVARVVWLLIDKRVRVTNDGAQYLLAARSWLDPTALPLYRERPSLFSVVWAPLLDLPHAGIAIMVVQGVITCIAAGIFFLGLRRLGASPTIAFVAGLLVVLVPTPIYYEHTLLSESLSFSATLILVTMLAWAIRPISAWRIGLVSLATLVLAGSLRNSFLIMFASFAAAGALVFVVSLLRRRRAGRPQWKTPALVTAALAVGAITGLVGISAINGLIAHRPLTEQMSNSSAMSGFNTAFKFGGLLDCEAIAEPDRAEKAICTDQAKVAPNPPSFDDLMWFGAVHEDWSSTSSDEFSALAPEYRKAGQAAVLDDPVGAAKIVVNDALGTLMPIYHEYFYNAPYPVSLLPTVAPNISVASDFGLQSKDTLYRVAGFFDAPRVLALFAALILLFVVRRHPNAPIVALLVVAWLVYWAGFAVTGVPTARFIFPMDPVLIAAVAIGASCLRVRIRVDADRSPEPATASQTVEAAT